MAKARWIRGKVCFIKVSSDVREQLKLLKSQPGENYDQVIRRLIQSYTRLGFRPRLEAI